jgi:hypothetical protein
MPWFRCTDPECEHNWFHHSVLDETPECLECGELAEIFDPDEGDGATTVATPDAAPRIAYARELARKRIADAGVSAPPVPVRELAEAEGLAIRMSESLGSLRVRS